MKLSKIQKQQKSTLSAQDSTVNHFQLGDINEESTLQNVIDHSSGHNPVQIRLRWD